MAIGVLGGCRFSNRALGGGEDRRVLLEQSTPPASQNGSCTTGKATTGQVTLKSPLSKSARAVPESL